MNKPFAFLLTAFTVFLLIGCMSENPVPSPSPVEMSPSPKPDESPEPSEAPETGKIHEFTEVTYSELITVSPGYELLATSRYPQTGVESIDSYYTTALDSFTSKAETLAEELRSYGETGFAATQYLFDDNYEIIKNSDDILAVHRTVYQYTGGVHGNHSDVCDNFRISDGKRLTLDDIFDCQPEEYTGDICGVFDRFINEHSSGDANYGFFPDAKITLRDIFPFGAFCITDTGLNFYLSPYFVTPYASGTIVIPVAWDELTVPRKDI